MSDPAALTRALHERDALARHLGIGYVEAGEGYATVRMTVGPEHLNFNGTCHGGAIFSLADTAFGLASNGHGTVAAAIDANLTFNVAVRQGERVTATATDGLGIHRDRLSHRQRPRGAVTGRGRRRRRSRSRTLAGTWLPAPR